MRKWRVQVFEGPRALVMWYTWGALEAVKNEAERQIALRWPTHEFSIEPYDGGR